MPLDLEWFSKYDFLDKLPRVVRTQLIWDILKFFFRSSTEGGSYGDLKRYLLSRPSGRWVLKSISDRVYPVNFTNKLFYEMVKILTGMGCLKKRDSCLTYELTTYGKESLVFINSTNMRMKMNLYLELGNESNGTEV